MVSLLLLLAWISFWTHNLVACEMRCLNSHVIWCQLNHLWQTLQTLSVIMEGNVLQPWPFCTMFDIFDHLFIMSAYVAQTTHQGSYTYMSTPLQWSHDEHDGISNHQPHDCLLNRLFKAKLKETSKLLVTGLCAGNSPEAGEFPHKRLVMWKMFPFDDVNMPGTLLKPDRSYYEIIL